MNRKTGPESFAQLALNLASFALGMAGADVSDVSAQAFRACTQATRLREQLEGQLDGLGLGGAKGRKS